MMREAESHADDDRKRKEEIETRNHADQAVYAAERLVKDSGDKLSRRGSAGDRVGGRGSEEGDRAQRRGRDEAADGGAESGAAQGGRSDVSHRRRGGRAGRRRGRRGGAARRDAGGGARAPTATSSTPRSWRKRRNNERWISTPSSVSHRALRAPTSSGRTAACRGGTIPASIRGTAPPRRCSGASPRRTRR